MPKLTQQVLETYLWGAANILRGKTAGHDYKTYILTLDTKRGLGHTIPTEEPPSLRCVGYLRGDHSRLHRRYYMEELVLRCGNSGEDLRSLGFFV